MWRTQEYKDRRVMEMREKTGAIPAELSGYEDIMFDGYCNPVEILSHSFVCKPIYIRLYHRRYKRSGSNRHYSNTYDISQNFKLWYVYEHGIKSTEKIKKTE